MTPGGDPAVDFRLLGAFEVVVRGEMVELGSVRLRLVLAMLALAGGRVVSADTLAEELWGGDPPADVANGLQSFISRARRVLASAQAGVTVAARGNGYVLDVTRSAVDAHRFSELARRGRGAGAAGDAAGAAVLLGEALALWRGPALTEFAHRAFAAGEAARLQEERLDATEALADALLAVGDPAAAAVLLEQLVADEPFREGSWARLMMSLYRLGRQADALRAYATVRRALAEELGLEPGAQLRELEHLILTQDPDLDARTPRARVAVHSARPHNLPVPVDRFVGRRAELAELVQILPATRLLTLWGPGGVGKTRLALEVAALAVPDFADGAWLVELAPHGRSEPVAAAVLSALGALVPAGEDDLVGVLCTYLMPRQCLLVLDNCEHLLDGAAQLVTAVLRTCPGVTVLATSREPLAVAGEQVWSVPPMSVPESRSGAADVAASDAGVLFCERAHAAHTAFALTDVNAPGVAEICRTLDGIPLALELAAARVRVLGVAGLAERLGDRFRLLTDGPRTAQTRHRTLRAAVDWSFELVPPAEQDLLARLSVFLGTFDLSAAEAVGRPVPAGEDALPVEATTDLLTRLVDRSLVVVVHDDGRVRYRLLETVRQYAAEQLAATGATDATERRHRAHYLAQPFMDWRVRWDWDFGWLRHVQVEYDNLRAALGRALDDGHDEDAYRLAAALYVYWIWAGVAGRDWIRRTIALPTRPRHPATAELLAAYEANWPGAPAGLCAEAVAIAEELGEPGLLAVAAMIGSTVGTHRNVAEPRRLLLLSERLSAEAAFTVGIAFCHHVNGWLAMLGGDYSQAVAHFERGLGVAPAQGPGLFIGPHMHGSLGVAAALVGDVDRALALTRTAIGEGRRAGLPGMLLMTLARGLAASTLAGAWTAAEACLREQVVLLRRLGTTRWVGETLEFAGLLLEATGRPEAASAALASAARFRAETGEAVGGMVPAVVAELERCRDRLGVGNVPEAAWEPALAAVLHELGPPPGQVRP